jgi:hypothetical protein
MKVFILTAFIFHTALAAQATVLEPYQSDPNVLKQEGSLVSIQLVRGSPVRFFVVGKEEAKFDPSELTLTVRRLKPYPAKMLNVERENGFYVVSEPLDRNGPTDLEVTAKLKNKSETHHFKVESKQP